MVNLGKGTSPMDPSWVREKKLLAISGTQETLSHLNSAKMKRTPFFGTCPSKNPGSQRTTRMSGNVCDFVEPRRNANSCNLRMHCQ